MPTAIPGQPVSGYPLPSSPPRYSFVAGTMGDTICGLGPHQHLMRSLGCESGAVLYYGPDPTIADWLRIQPMVSEVVDVRSPGPVKGIPTDPERMVEWWPDFAEHFKIHFGHRQVWPCHVDFTLRERLPVHRPELVTATELREWASGVVGIGRNILFQPRSETSCLWEGHWPHWIEACRWFSFEDGHAPIFLCGLSKWNETEGHWPDAFADIPWVTDFVNKTPSMPHLFALADLCDVIVTTSNALSLYAASKGLPTVVCCNTTHRRPLQFFTRFAKGPRSRIVEHWDPLEKFKQAWAEVVAL